MGDNTTPLSATMLADFQQKRDSRLNSHATAIQSVSALLPARLSRDRETTAQIDMIVLHSCSDIISHPDDPYNVRRVIDNMSTTGAFAHYLIDRDGVVHELVPVNRVAFHAGRGRIDWQPE